MPFKLECKKKIHHITHSCRRRHLRLSLHQLTQVFHGPAYLFSVLVLQDAKRILHTVYENPVVCIRCPKEAMQSSLTSSTMGEQLSGRSFDCLLCYQTFAWRQKSTDISNSDGHHGCPTHAGAIIKAAALS